MAVDGIEGQGRGIFLLSRDLPIWHQPQLHQGLEAIADPQGQAIPLLKQLRDSLLHLLILEGRGEELGTAIRLIPCGEPSGEHNDLGLPDGFYKLVHGLPDILCTQIAEHLRDHICPCPLKGLAAVVFAVGSREHRDKHGGPCHLMPAHVDPARLVAGTFHRLPALHGPGGKDLLQPGCPGGQGLLQGNLHAFFPYGTTAWPVVHKSRLFCNRSDLHRVMDRRKHRIHLICLHFCQDIPQGVLKERLCRHIPVYGHAQLVAEGHLGQGGGRTPGIQGIGRDDHTFLHQSMNGSVQFCHGIISGDIIVILLDLETHQHIAGLLQFRCDYLAVFCHIHRKRYQCGGHVNVIEGARHAVLAADGRQAETDLGVIRSQQGCKRLAPAGRVLRHPAEILLEGEPYPGEIPAAGHDPGHGLHHRIDSPVIGTPGGQIRVKTICHHGHGVRPALQHGQLRHHGLGLRQLIFSPVGHEHAGRTDGRVKHLHQPLLGTYIQVAEQGKPCPFHIPLLQLLPHPRHGPFLEIILLLVRDIHLHGSLLVGAVGIQEGPLQVHDLPAPPG